MDYKLSGVHFDPKQNYAQNVFYWKYIRFRVTYFKLCLKILSMPGTGPIAGQNRTEQSLISKTVKTVTEIFV